MTSLSSGIAFGVVLFIGVFEFKQIYDNLFLADRMKPTELLPAHFSEEVSIRWLYCTFLAMLAMQRLTFAFGSWSSVQWLMLILTHVFELIFWWALALQPHFNTKQVSLGQLVVDVYTGKASEDKDSVVVLVILPILVTYFAIYGSHYVMNSKTSSKSKRN